MPRAPAIKVNLKARQKQLRLRRARTNLYWLATEVLGYTLLTEDFHKPILDEWDERRKLRAAGRYRKNELEMWPRNYYKTTCRIAWVIQTILIDPMWTFIWWHAVEEMAQEAVQEVGKQLQTNRELRDLWMEIMPPPLSRGKKWCSAKGFAMPARGDGMNKWKKHSRDWTSLTCRPFGAGSEATGGHARTGIPDDIIGLNTIQDSLMPKVRKWWAATVTNVINPPPVGFCVGQGTRWAEDDIYSDWIKRKRDWDVRIRGCYETEGKPDWDGVPVLFTRDQIEQKRRGMNFDGEDDEAMSDWDFSCQMMNDPNPEKARIWSQKTCERDIFIDQEDTRGPGFVVVLSDPAPAHIGSQADYDRRKRMDGSKDDWATCAVKLRQVGMRREIILLDGDFSIEWDIDAGFRFMCQLQRRFQTPYCAYERVGQAIAAYESTHRRIAREEGAKFRLIELTMTYAGKNVQFDALASRAKNDEFLISKGCNPHFVEKFLAQSRGWRAIGKRNSLKFDDLANVVSFACDPVFDTRYAQADEPPEWSPFALPDAEDEPNYQSRYIAW